MDIKTAKVSDSVRLSAIQTDRFKTGILTFTLTSPLTPQNYAYNIVLAGILRRGTKNYPSLAALNLRLDELYASGIEIRSQKNAKNLSLTVTAEILDDRYVIDGTDILGGVVDVVADILFYPLSQSSAFSKDTVISEIRTAIDSIDAEINNTRLYSAKRCQELMYRNDPSYPSTERIKQALQEADEVKLYKHYKTLISSSAIDIFYIGNADINTVSQKLRPYFEHHAPISPYIPIFPSIRGKVELTNETEQMPVSQGKLSLGFSTGICMDKNDQYYAVLLFNEIFGSSPSSKLFLNVREKLGLCYYCSSLYSICTGDLTVSAGIEVKNKKLSLDEIFRQLDSVKQGEISEYELSAAKKSLCNTYRQIYDNPLDIQSFFSIREMFGINETIEEAIDKISRVTKDEIIDIANNTVLDTIFFVEGTLSTTEGDDEDYE